jgi:hypothetical protein
MPAQDVPATGRTRRVRPSRHGTLWPDPSERRDAVAATEPSEGRRSDDDPPRTAAVPLDAHEEAQFQQIAEQLLGDDPAFGSERRWSPTWSAAGPVAAGAALLLALASLPLALWSGLWPIGLAGYVVATFAGARLTHVLRPHLADAVSRTTPTHAEAMADPRPAPTDRTRAGRSGVAWAAGIAVVAVIGAVLLAPTAGTTTDRADRAPAASASEPDEGRQLPPFVRRAPGRSAAVTDAAAP